MSRSHDFGGSLPQTFLIDARQPKVGFLHSWAVVFTTFSGKSSLLVRVEELNNANLIESRHITVNWKSTPLIADTAGTSSY